MREENKAKRQIQIEAAAYKVLEDKGYVGASMLAIANAAKASNETLYNWYGDKRGLFQALVVRNAAELKTYLETALAVDSDAHVILSALGPKLLELLTSERAIALNRAAAADNTGELGETLAQSGREAIFPLLARVVDRAAHDGLIRSTDTEAAVVLYLDLLVGDMQIRRVIGSLKPPSQKACTARAALALQRWLTLSQTENTSKD